MEEQRNKWEIEERCGNITEKISCEEKKEKLENDGKREKGNAQKGDGGGIGR